MTWRTRLDHPRLWTATVVGLFVVWGLFGLTQSPGFTLDEAPIIDSALSLVNHGYLSVPSAGPGNAHDTGYLYQFPLHPVFLSVVFRLFGAGLLQGRLLSLFLATCTLILVASLMKPYGYWAMLVAVSLLAVDPLFSARAREIRYDWIALLGMVCGYKVLTQPDYFAHYRYLSRYGRFLVAPFTAGIFIGVSISSHFLYVLIIPVFLIICLFFSSTPNPTEKVSSAIAFLAGVCLTLIPVSLYIVRHPVAFRDQFLWQITAHRSHNQELTTWVSQEAAKYLRYYRLSPFVFIVCLLSLGTLLYYFTFGARFLRGSTHPRLQGSTRQLFVVSIGLPFLLALASGHNSWHHIMVAPFWAMVCGASIYWVWEEGTNGYRVVFTLVIGLAILNGLLTSWAARTYSAVQSWSTRDIETVESYLVPYVPDNSGVYGDYRLLFAANRHNWRFTAAYFVLNVDQQALSRIGFDYLVLSEMTGQPVWLDPSQYIELVTLTAPSPPFKLPPINSANQPIRLRIYKRTHD